MKNFDKLYAEYCKSAESENVCVKARVVLDKLEAVLSKRQFIEFESMINEVIDEAEAEAFRCGYRAASK